MTERWRMMRSLFLWWLITPPGVLFTVGWSLYLSGIEFKLGDIPLFGWGFLAATSATLFSLAVFIPLGISLWRNPL